MVHIVGFWGCFNYGTSCLFLAVCLVDIIWYVLSVPGWCLVDIIWYVLSVPGGCLVDIIWCILSVPGCVFSRHNMVHNVCSWVCV